MFAILLVVVPILFAMFRKQQGDYDLGLDVFALTAACWGCVDQ
jgi:fumarate reductase subunit D